MRKTQLDAIERRILQMREEELLPRLKERTEPYVKYSTRQKVPHGSVPKVLRALKALEERSVLSVARFLGTSTFYARRELEKQVGLKRVVKAPAESPLTDGKHLYHVYSLTEAGLRLLEEKTSESGQEARNG